MDLRITTTAEQDTALDRSLADSGSQQTREQFALADIAVRVLNFHTDRWKAEDASALRQRLANVANKLDDTDKAALETILAKHEVVEEPVIVEEVIP